MTDTSKAAVDAAPEFAGSDVAVTELLARLSRAVRRSRELDAAAQAELDVAMIKMMVVPELRDLVDSTVEILDEVEERYRSTPTGKEVSVSEEVEIDDVDVESMFGVGNGDEAQETTGEPETMADLCFVGRFELQQAAAKLHESLDDIERNELVGRCARCRGSIVNVASVIDRAVARIEGWMRVVDTVPELEESLAVRAAYAALRDELDSVDMKDGEPNIEALTKARTALQKLIDPRIANLLRVADRDNVIRLYGRVERWIEGGGQDLTVGKRLWEEVTFVAEMLLQVNNRQELLAHDATTARRLAHKLESSEGGLAWVDRNFFADLYLLKGRDAALDSALGLIEAIVHGQLAAGLSHVAEELAHAVGSTAAEAEGTDGEGGSASEPPAHEMFEFDLESAFDD